MNFNEADFNQGVELGVAKARLKLENQRLLLSRYGRAIIRDSLERYTSDLNGRFVELFVELTTLATITREQYDEPELTKAQMDEFLEFTVSFFNSFTHRVVEDRDESNQLVNSGSGSATPLVST